MCYIIYHIMKPLYHMYIKIRALKKIFFFSSKLERLHDSVESAFLNFDNEF